MPSSTVDFVVGIKFFYLTVNSFEIQNFYTANILIHSVRIAHQAECSLSCIACLLVSLYCTVLLGVGERDDNKSKLYRAPSHMFSSSIFLQMS